MTYFIVASVPVTGETYVVQLSTPQEVAEWLRSYGDQASFIIEGSTKRVEDFPYITPV